MSELFSQGPMPPLQEKFDYHVITIMLPQGSDSYPTLKIECKGADKDDCVCEPAFCHMQDLYNMVGWECLRAAGEIELARLSARLDFTDPDEVWIDVEP